MLSLECRGHAGEAVDAETIDLTSSVSFADDGLTIMAAKICDRPSAARLATYYQPVPARIPALVVAGQGYPD